MPCHMGMDLPTTLVGERNEFWENRQGRVNASYTMLGTNQSSGCQNTMIILIPDDREYPVITLSKIDNTRCITPYNGSASINTLTYNGAAVASPYIGYSFAWSNGATGITVTQQSEAAFTLEVTK